MRNPVIAALSLAAMLSSLPACSPRPGTTDNAATVATSTGSGAATGATPCTPLETRDANAPSQQPKFRGQTRACGVKSSTSYAVTVVARGLDKPWAVEPLPDGSFLITEKRGTMRIVSSAGQIGAPIAGIPRVDSGGQGGLLDVALSPQFATDRTIFWSFTEPREGGNGTSVARGTLSADRTRVDGVKVIFRALPTYDNNMHFGSRIEIGPDGMLYVTLGERSDTPMRQHAQRLDSHLGKIVRVAPDGSVPRDNPFVGRAGALPEIWSMGHRNIQSAAFDGQGRFWEVEHGTRGGDELNLVQKGKNYGWPIVAFGEEYFGSKIDGAVTTREGYEDPVYYWDPVIAPSGAQFYSGSAFPEWRGNLFVGALKEQRLVRLVIENGRVTGEEHLLTDRGERIRDVKQGPDGALYVVTDESNGELWRIAPAR